MKLLRFRYLEIEKISNQSFYLTRKKSIEIKKGEWNWNWNWRWSRDEILQEFPSMYILYSKEISLVVVDISILIIITITRRRERKEN